MITCDNPGCCRNCRKPISPNLKYCRTCAPKDYFKNLILAKPWVKSTNKQKHPPTPLKSPNNTITETKCVELNKNGG